MFDSLQHPSLVVCVFNLLHLDYLRLLQDLDRIVTLVVLGLHQMHSAKRTSAECSLKGEVGQSVFALCLPARGFTIDGAACWADQVGNIHVAVCLGS